MRFRPANISLINRRHYLPRLLLTLSSKKQKQKPPHQFADVDRVTPYHFRIGDSTTGTRIKSSSISPALLWMTSVFVSTAWIIISRFVVVLLAAQIDAGSIERLDECNLS